MPLVTTRVGQAVGAREPDDLEQVLAHRRLAAEELDGGLRVVLGEVLEDAVEILHRRLEEEAHARRVVDADRAVQVAAVGHVEEDHVRLLAAAAMRAVERAALVVVAEIERALGVVARGVAGDQAFGRPAGRALLDQEDLVIAFDRSGRRQLAAGAAVCQVQRGSLVENCFAPFESPHFSITGRASKRSIPPSSRINPRF